eukprot:11157670-Lingulodinium_polyedra.AAC.1
MPEIASRGPVILSGRVPLFQADGCCIGQCVYTMYSGVLRVLPACLGWDDIKSLLRGARARV